MAQAQATERVQAPIDTVFQVIRDYEKYPQFLPMCKKVRVVRNPDQSIDVEYTLDLFKEIQYKIKQRENAESHSVEWILIESGVFKKNDGSWKLRKISDTLTEAHYSLDLDFKIPVPGFVLKKLVQVSLPEMMKAFLKEAEKRAKNPKL